ncbi:MAG: hypothetical protein RBT60_14225 [Candidatus Krumholzibacteria bacterium]|nr:hypothetical protein [Candidatus Krumholzibacteria bacterium]
MGEELLRVLQVGQDGVHELARVRPLGRDLFELAQAPFDLLTFGQEAAEAVLHQFAVVFRRVGHQVDHRVDLRREFLLARLEAAPLRSRVGPRRGELSFDQRAKIVPPPRAQQGVYPLRHVVQHEVVEHPLQKLDRLADRLALGDRGAADVVRGADAGAVLAPLVLPGGAAVQRTAAGAAADQTGQQVGRVLGLAGQEAGRLAVVAARLLDALGAVKGVLVDEGLVGVLEDEPILRIVPFEAALAAAVALHFAAVSDAVEFPHLPPVPGHPADVGGVHDDHADGRHGPALGLGRDDAFAVQAVGDGLEAEARAAGVPGEDAADHVDAVGGAGQQAHVLAVGALDLLAASHGADGVARGIEDQLLAVVGVADDLEELAVLVEVAQVVAVGRHAAGPPALVGQGNEPTDDGLRKRGRFVAGGLLLEEAQVPVGGRAGETLGRVDDLDPGLREEVAIVAHLVAGHAAETLDVPDQDATPLAAVRAGRVQHGQEAVPVLARGAGDAVVDELGHDLEAVLGGVAEDLLALVAEGFLLAVGGAAQVDGRGDAVAGSWVHGDIQPVWPVVIKSIAVFAISIYVASYGIVRGGATALPGLVRPDGPGDEQAEGLVQGGRVGQFRALDHGEAGFGDARRRGAFEPRAGVVFAAPLRHDSEGPSAGPSEGPSSRWTWPMTAASNWSAVSRSMGWCSGCGRPEAASFRG